MLAKRMLAHQRGRFLITFRSCFQHIKQILTFFKQVPNEKAYDCIGFAAQRINRVCTGYALGFV